MHKEMLVFWVNRVVYPKRIIRKKWRAEEEERHKRSTDPKKLPFFNFLGHLFNSNAHYNNNAN
jgi:hypothetical protein